MPARLWPTPALAANSPVGELGDLFLGGRLRLRQAAHGHRAGTDAALLQACAPADARGLCIDVGAGVGAAGLSALVRAPALDMVLAEIDSAACARAAENIALNGLQARVVEADVLRPAARRAAGLADGAADMVLTNPPFYAPGAARASPDADRARAHMGEIGPWMKAALALLKPGGWFYMIHRPDALPDILAACEGRLGGLRLKPVLPRADAPAIRLLLSGRKASRAPLAILPGLTLHRADGAFTPLAQAIHLGETGLDMS